MAESRGAGSGRPAPSRRFVGTGRSVWALVLAAALIAVLAWPLLRGTDRPGERLDALPPELIGRWTTGAERYAGRFLELRPGSVVLGFGEEGSRQHAIDEVRTWAGPDHRAYHVVYASEGEQVIEMYLYDDGTLRLRNPADVVWTRGPDPGGDLP